MLGLVQHVGGRDRPLGFGKGSVRGGVFGLQPFDARTGLGQCGQRTGMGGTQVNLLPGSFGLLLLDSGSRAFTLLQRGLTQLQGDGSIRRALAQPRQLVLCGALLQQGVQGAPGRRSGQLEPPDPRGGLAPRLFGVTPQHRRTLGLRTRLRVPRGGRGT